MGLNSTMQRKKLKNKVILRDPNVKDSGRSNVLVLLNLHQD